MRQFKNAPSLGLRAVTFATALGASCIAPGATWAADAKRDPAAQLETCEASRKLPNEVRELCDAVLANDKATDRQRARALTRIAYAVRWIPNSPRGQYLEQAMAADPAYDRPHLAQASDFLLANKPAEAMTLFEDVLKRDPDNAMAHLGVGRVKQMLGNNGAAYEAMSKAVELGIEGPDAYYHRGVLLLQAGYNKEAIVDLTEASARYSNLDKAVSDFIWSDPIVPLAETLVRDQQPARAVDILGDLDNRPMDKMAKVQLLALRADANSRIGRYEDAINDIDTALNLAPIPMRPMYEMQKSKLLSTAGKFRAASKNINEVLKTADLRTVLRIQVFLRNHGYQDVEISGEIDAATREAARSCFSNETCGVAISRHI